MTAQGTNRFRLTARDRSLLMIDFAPTMLPPLTVISSLHVDIHVDKLRYTADGYT
jgi:hypothetical protein